MFKRELSSSVISDIKEAWKIFFGSDTKIHINNLNLFLQSIGFNLQEEEIKRIIKEKANITDEYYITFDNLISILKIKYKTRKMHKEINNIISAYKNRKKPFIRSNINLMENDYGMNLDYDNELNEENEFVINKSDLIYFCKENNIEISMDDVKKMINDLGDGKEYINSSDIKYILKKTMFIYLYFAILYNKIYIKNQLRV